MKTFTPEQYRVISRFYEKRYGSKFAITAEGDVDMTRNDEDRSQSIMYISSKDALTDALDQIIYLELQVDDLYKNNYIQSSY